MRTKNETNNLLSLARDAYPITLVCVSEPTVSGNHFEFKLVRYPHQLLKLADVGLA